MILTSNKAQAVYPFNCTAVQYSGILFDAFYKISWNLRIKP